jgi:hypothetical protein
MYLALRNCYYHVDKGCRRPSTTLPLQDTGAAGSHWECNDRKMWLRRVGKYSAMSTPSMGVAVTTGASPQESAPSMPIAWGSTGIKTLLIHQAAKCWWKARFSDVPFRLSLLLPHHVGDRSRRTEILDGTSHINYQQLDRLPNCLSHVSVWLYSGKPGFHLCIRV